MPDNPQFDATLAEDAVGTFLNDKLHPTAGFSGMPFSVFHSDEPGVIAFERPSFYDTEKFRWDELAAVVARETGYGVVCIAHCDWEVEQEDYDEDADEDENDEDGPRMAVFDEEAVLIAFDIPELDPEYRDDPRNMIDPVSPDTAPSAEDFRIRDQAVRIIAGRKAALKGHLQYLPDNSDERAASQSELDRLDAYDAAASNRQINDAIVDLDFALACELMTAQDQENEAAPAPTP